MEKKSNKKLIFLVINLSLILIYLTHFINIKFENISFEQLLYTLIKSDGANLEIVFNGFFFVLIRLILTNLVILLLIKLFIKLKLNVKVCLKINAKEYKKDFFKISNITIYLMLLIFLSLTIGYCLKSIGYIDYYKMQKETSFFIEDNYVDGKKINIEFPEKKRNLIYIYAESLESSNVSKNNGGIVNKPYTPKLEKLALENINFSNNDKIGGARNVIGTGWTIAALMAATSGVPLKIDIYGNDYIGYGDSLPGVYNLGDILYDNGYDNYLMIGSKAEFGGRKDYFTSHGNYNIYDYDYMIETGKLNKDYFVWWGYEDKKLFKYAKEKLTEISKDNQPFNFTILTVDTHFTDGYVDKSCKNIFDSKYANALYCSDEKINDFISWIKKQDFYDNTTIIISGDHLTMQSNFYDDKYNDDRKIYNAFINSAIEPINEKNRDFSSFDMFPTTLASLGVKFEGNRLGLGVNLFSEEKTLVEKYGIEYVEQEIAKKSMFYNNIILGDTYYKMQEELQKSANNN